MYRNIKTNVFDGYRKNKDDFRAFLFRIYPEFIYKEVEKIPLEEIPVFTFHSAEPETFEDQIRYLAENRYRTVTADKFVEILTGRVINEENTIVLTFDDGVGSLWSVVCPVLKKYGLSAISFILPSRIEERSERHPTLQDVWAGKAAIAEIRARERSAPFLNWEEIRQIHHSGVIDFQSHTSFHHSVFVSDKIVDFLNPSMNINFLQSSLSPVFRKNGRDVMLDTLEHGRPIYEWAPAMRSNKRYLEDEELGNQCVDFVLRNGGDSFFTRSGWRQLLKGHMRDFTKKEGNNGRFQSASERFKEIREDLLQSKKLIESKLDKEVKHLCYPWYEGGDLSVKASKEIGFICNYWGILKNRSINRVGDDPYYVVRINNDYIHTLPGKGRESALKVFKKKIENYRNNKFHGCG
jgi:peptidoglycan/xylan/chitin deacetylase (PgdA/CDA1 family)